jgi:hypothetical protein
LEPLGRTVAVAAPVPVAEAVLEGVPPGVLDTGMEADSEAVRVPEPVWLGLSWPDATGVGAM